MPCGDSGRYWQGIRCTPTKTRRICHFDAACPGPGRLLRQLGGSQANGLTTVSPLIRRTGRADGGRWARSGPRAGIARANGSGRARPQGSRSIRSVRVVAREPSTRLQEFIGRYTRLPENGAQSALGDIAGVVGDRGVPIRLRMEPDLMRPCRLPVESETERPQASGNLPAGKARQPSHLCRYPLTTSG